MHSHANLTVWFLVAALVMPALAVPKQATTVNGSQHPSAAQGASESNPIFMKLIPETHSEADLAREKAKEDAVASDSQKLTDFTGDLARYTKLLAYGTFALAGLTVGLLALGAFQIFDSKRSIAAAEKAANAAAAQVALGRDEFNATFRPHLKVRHVSLGAPKLPFTSSPGIGDQVVGGLVIVNRGNTRATIVDSRYLIYFSQASEGLPMLSPMDDRWTELVVPETTLDVGQSLGVGLSDIIATDRQTHDTFIRIGPNDWAVYVMGQVQYLDESGNERFMGFCRRWLGEGTFEAVPNSDYEYED